MLDSFVATSRRSRLIAEFITLAWFLAAGQVFASDRMLSIDRVNTMPLSFTQNNGQWNEQVLFRGNSGGATMWFTKESVTYQFTRRISKENTPLNPLSRGDSQSSVTGLTQSVDDPHVRGDSHSTLTGASPSADIPLLRGARGVSNDDSVITMSISATFVGANPNPQVIGEGLTEYKCNYFIGNEPEKWYTNVPNYRAVIYKDIYPGIDLKYYGYGDGKIEYDFIISPNANPSQIAIRYDGADEVCVDDQGQLIVETEWGRVTERAPVVWQVVDGDTRKVSADYVQKEEDTFGFKLDEGYEPEYAVVVDPVLSYSTYLGGGDYDFGFGIAIDASCSVYVTGYTSSPNFPTQSPYQTNQVGADSEDVFVTTLSKSGDSLIYSTCLGGARSDHGSGIAVDGNSNAYVTGHSESSDFPTQNPCQSTNHGSQDAFVAKISDISSDVTEIEDAVLPSTHELSQNFPNPFNPTTEIEFSLPRSSHVTIRVFNILGENISKIVDERLHAGRYRASWNGKDDSGKEVPSGIYLYRLEAGDYVDGKKMLLLK